MILIISILSLYIKSFKDLIYIRSFLLEIPILQHVYSVLVMSHINVNLIFYTPINPKF